MHSWIVRRLAVGSIAWLGPSYQRARACRLVTHIDGEFIAWPGGWQPTRSTRRALAAETEQEATTIAPDQCTERQQHKNAERKCREKHGEARREMSDAHTSPRQSAN